ncbi:MAG: methionyl-tRNA formyltransferase [Geodermatophilaceae bacterium]|nr:methionyl-tRNA formyltransferase [Geodermatophilaceae bacterium]
MRIVFAGTPEAAVPSLRAVLGSDRHEVLAVLTRPDAPTGRGRRLWPSAVAEVGAEHGLELLRPARVSDPEFLARLAVLAPDCCPVVAYGGLIPAPALAVPRHGWVNLHFSLLPAWRGAAPVQHAVIAGDDVTGATTFRLEQGLDTGPVYGVLTEPIGPRDTAGDVLARLAASGADLLLATLDGIEAGRLDARPQPAEGVSHAPKLTVADARIDWSAPSVAVDRRIRGCTPAPGAWTTVGDERLRLGLVVPLSTVDVLGPGELRIDRDGVVVGTATRSVRLGDVQPPGKRFMPAVAWIRGLRTPPAVLQ